MNLYKHIMNIRMSFLYPLGWAFVLGTALGAGYVIGVAIELRRCVAG